MARTPYTGGSATGPARVPYTGQSAPDEPTKKSGGLLHDLERVVAPVGHLATDIGSAALGFGPGLVRVTGAAGHDVVHGAFLDPLHRLQDMGTGSSRQSKSQLAPIAKQAVAQYKDYYGHDVLHHIYQHPLQPILDAATLASLGASAGVKAGLISGDRATIITRSPRAVSTGKGPIQRDITSTSPLVRLRAQGVAKARAARPEGLVPGTTGTKAANVRVGGEFKTYGKQIASRAGHSAMRKLTPLSSYQKATHRLTPDEWTALHLRAGDVHPADLAEAFPELKRVLTPKVEALVLKPTDRMVKAEPQLREISKQSEKLAKSQGWLADDTAEARPALIRRQAGEILGRPARVVTGDPYYFPHALEPEPVRSPLKMGGGGKAHPRVPGTMKQNEGILLRTGKMHLSSDLLGPEFLRRVKVYRYSETHNALRRGAIRATAQEIRDNFGGKAPQGWDYLRTPPVQKIPPTMRGESDIRMPLTDAVPDPHDLQTSPLSETEHGASPFTTKYESGALKVGDPKNPSYYLVPKNMAKAATGEFTRSNAAVHFINRYPLKAWRAVILGLRVGFLTNNLVGNSIMYATKTGGHGALRDLFQTILEHNGREAGLKILGNPVTPPDLRNSLMKEFYPEQTSRGTFGMTQSPATEPFNIGGQGPISAARAVTGAIPKLTSKVAEEIPRQAVVRNLVRRSPEFKQVWSTLPKQTRTFTEAHRQILEGKGGAEFQRRISKDVNNALGDYLNLSPFERNVLRNTLPFYSWYKAIATVTFHMAVDTPLRTNILGQIGQIGKQWSDQQLGQVPSFLKAAIPLGHGGDGTTKVLGTQGLNPYATLSQLERGSATDYSSLGLNPFVEGPMQYLQAHSGNVSPGQLLLSPLKDLVRGLPPSRLIAPMPPSKLYPNRNRNSELWSYLGVPIKEYNPAVAANQAKVGR